MIKKYLIVNHEGNILNEVNMYGMPYEIKEIINKNNIVLENPETGEEEIHTITEIKKQDNFVSGVVELWMKKM